MVRRPARAAPKRGAEREAQYLVWRVAEILQVIPLTHGEEMAIQVHLYETYHHHRDVGERVYQPAFRDTKDDKEDRCRVLICSGIANILKF